MTDRSATGLARLGTLVWLLAATAGLFVQLGYSFETNDQVQYLLLPYREIYPDFLPGDWFTWSTSHYHVTFAWIVRGLHALLGEQNFRFGMLAAHLASLALLAWSFLRVARSLGAGWLEASFALFVFVCARDEGLGGAVLNHGCLVPSDLAFAPFLLATAACVERRPLATGVWLGIAGFLHANFAVLGPVVVLPAALLGAWPQLRDAGSARSRALRGLAITCAVYALLAAPSLWLLVGSFLTSDPNPAAVAITLFVRSPHHYDLSAMRPLDFYWALLLFLLTLPAWIGPYALPRRAAALTLCGILLGLIALGVLGAALKIVPLARLFMFRLSIPLFALWLIALARVVHAIVRRREPGALVWAIAALLTLAMFVREDLLTLAPFSQPQQLDPRFLLPPHWLFASVLAPLGLATAGLIALGGALRRNLAIGLFALAPLGVSLWVSQVPLGQYWTGTRLRAARSFHYADRRIEFAAPDRDLYRKTRELTPNDARFLIAPGLFEFRMRARRSVFVDWKCTPMRGDEASEWRRRMLLAMGSSDFPSSGFSLPTRADALYYARPLLDLIAIARSEGLDYIIVRRHQLDRRIAGVRIAFSSGSFVVLKVES